MTYMIECARMKKEVILFILLVVFVAVLKVNPASSFVLTKDLKDEIEENQWLVKVHPEDAQSHFDLAISYAYSNKIEDGLNELKKVDQLDKTFAPKAVKIYSRKARLFPDNWKIRFRYAFALYFNGKKKEAITEFQKIIKQDPKNVFSYGYIATIYGEMNELDKAVEYAKKAIEIDSNVAAIHLLLGAGYYKKGDPSKGLAETMEALRLRALGY
jgi:tetratricopeptide (TPR) repeat protein